MASRENPFEKAIIWRYHKMMGVHRHVTEAIVRHVASIEDVIMHKDLVRAFVPLFYAAKTSSLRSDDVISLVQEFDECFKNTKDAIKCLHDFFFVCRKPRNEDRIIQKILKYLQNPYHSKKTETELMEELIKEAERTQKQIDAEIQARIIQWLKEQRDNMTITIHPFEKEIIWWYHKMMGVLRQLREAVVPLLDTILLHAAKTSSLKSDDVISLVQEFDECFDSTMDAIKCSDDSFFDCPKQLEEDRMLQKILKDLQNRYEAYETEGTEEMKKDGFYLLMAVNTAVNVICPLPAYSYVIRL